jgi:hypothetical protein
MPSRTDKVSISIRLDGSVHKKLTEYVTAVGGTMNGEIQRRLAESFLTTGEREAIGPQLTRLENQVSAVLALLSKPTTRKA